MKLLRTVIFFACATPLLFGASKEILELQRDMDALKEQVRQLNERLVVINTLVQTTLESTQRSNAAIGTMQDRVNDSLKKQQETVTAPVLGVGQKLDQMGEDFRAVRETVLDLSSRIGKIDQKLSDLQQTVNVIKTGPAAPPPSVGGPASTLPPASSQSAPLQASMGGTAPGSMPTAGTSPPPGMQAEVTYTNSYRDYLGGQYDLAMNEFQDYLRYFPTTQFAPNAQYYIGDIFFRRKDYANAIIAFDAVLEHFSENSKTPDSHLMKGRSLMALGKRDAAAREFREVVSRYPDTEQAAKAKAMLKELGLNAASSTPKRRPARKR